MPRSQCTKVKTSLGRAQHPHRQLKSAAAHLGPSGTRRRRRSCLLAWWSQIGCLPPSEADSPQKACRAQLNGLTYVARSHCAPLPGHICCRSARCDLATWHVSAQRAYVDQADLAAALSSMGSPGLCHVVGSTHSQRQRIQPAEHQEHRRAGGDMGCAGGVSK
mgnify:CR=1 FL=1